MDFKSPCKNGFHTQYLASFSICASSLENKIKCGTFSITLTQNMSLTLTAPHNKKH